MGRIERVNEIWWEGSSLFANINGSDGVGIDEVDVTDYCGNRFALQFAIGLADGETERGSPDDCG